MEEAGGPGAAGGRRIRALAGLAFVAPAGVAFARLVTLARRQPNVPSGDVVAAILAALWIAVALALPPVRRLLFDLGEWLIARLPWPLLLVATLLCASFATSVVRETAWVAATAAGACLALGAIGRAAALAPRRLARTSVLVALNLVLLVVADLVVRVTILPWKSHNSLFITHDPWLGWKLRPGFTIDRTTDTYRSHETSNRLGFRGPERPPEKPAGVRRIVLLGDSHTEGYTVSDGETYGERLEQHASERAPVQVIALGVGGFSTDQEYLAYLHYGRQFHPDLVLLQFCGNDLEYNVRDRYWRGTKPRFVRFDDQLVLENVPVPDLRLSFTHDTWLEHSAIAMVLEVSLGRWSMKEEIAAAWDEEEAWRVTGLLLRDLASVVHGDGAELAVFDAGPDAVEVDQRLQAVCKERSIRFLDIAPAFGGDYAGHRVKNDLHWNARGHEAVGRCLAGAVAPLLGER